MKPLIVSLAVLAIASTCCIPSVLTPTAANPTPVEPLVTEPLVSEPPVTAPPVVITEVPVVTATPTNDSISCDILSIDLDPALAGGYTCEVFPEDEFWLTPAYAYYTLNGYVFAFEFYAAKISVLPVAKYIEIDSAVSDSIAELQALIAGAAPGSTLPDLPPHNANQEFHAHVQAVAFGNGNGIRYLTQYIQMEYPVNNGGLVYIYQGLTSDGKYWISVSFPTSHPSLPEWDDPLPGGQTMRQFEENFATYVADVTVQIEGFPDNTFQPSLTALDNLISSFAILP